MATVLAKTAAGEPVAVNISADSLSIADEIGPLSTAIPALAEMAAGMALSEVVLRFGPYSPHAGGWLKLAALPDTPGRFLLSSYLEQ